MAWNANEKGNYANLTKQAKEHGGVDKFIDDIHNEGYQEGHERGLLEGVGITTVVITVVALGTYKFIEPFIKRNKAKKQAVAERSKAAQEAIRKICEEADCELHDDMDSLEIDESEVESWENDGY